MKIHSGVILLLGALTAASGRLHAQTAGISYSSSAGCPDERQFREQLALHLRAGPPPLMRPIAVDAQLLEAHSVARVRFQDDNGVWAVRELSAPTCPEVVTAAALVVALAIDSRGQPQKTPAAKPPAPPNHDAPAPSPMVDKRPPASDAPARLFLQFGGGVIAHTVITPEPMLGATAFAGLGESRSWDLRAAFVYAVSGEVTRDAQSAEFALLAGRLDGCALPLLNSPRFSLDPCLAVELGSVRSVGIESERYTSSEQTAFWMAAGPLLRGQVFFDLLRLEGYAGPWFPIVGRQSFVFRRRDDNRTFHDVPLVGVIAGLNLALAIDWPGAAGRSALAVSAAPSFL